jgi:hypothetical protein
MRMMPVKPLRKILTVGNFLHFRWTKGVKIKLKKKNLRILQFNLTR